MIRALVPLKELQQAKTRLAPLLNADGRRDFATAMVEDVLRLLAAHPAIDEVTLLSDDPDAAQLAARTGAQHCPEHTLHCRGLNPAVTAASDLMLASDDDVLLVLHGDLPLLTHADLDAVLQRLAERGGLAIGCDSDGLGTNLLAFGRDAMPRFSFGLDSCRQHMAWAHTAGVPVTLVERRGIALDVDAPADLQLLLRCSGKLAAGATADFLAGTQLQPFPEDQSGACLAADWQALREQLLAGQLPTDEQALALATFEDTAALAGVAGELRDRGHGQLVTYSRKVFIPLTHLCRDVCHYCTFARTPKKIEQPFMPVEEVLALCREGARQGCQEALFTLGEKPELRYATARRALEEMGFESTLDYVRHVAGRVLEETGLLPHINAGCMTGGEIASLRQVSASMGIMLESASERLCDRGMPHYGSPDKQPAVRLETLELAGEAAVPFTSGILIGIGETRRERIESLLALRRSHARHGHLQEVIVQNFRAKPGTLMAAAPEPDLDDLLWTIAVARLLFGAQMNIQAPPNLSPGVLPQLVAAGINDWGGVSPLTPDHVNPEAPWPHLEKLARETAVAGKFLEQRLTIYPAYARESRRWLDPVVRPAVLRHVDAAGFARRDHWVPGEERPVPQLEQELLATGQSGAAVSREVRDILQRCAARGELEEGEVQRLFECRGPDFSYLVAEADRLRRESCGDRVSYVVNRNINYTNVCYFKCQFCAFSKGKQSENLRGRPYDISGEEIAARCSEAWQRGATEVCMQGGIHPDYSGQTYLDILHTVRAATPAMHIHAFSPLEVWQGAATLGIDVRDFLVQLQAAGLNTLPGTAAEILDDDVRALLCPDKLNSEEWLQVMETAHSLGLRSTATIMYGHVDEPRHWARHLLRIRRLQQRSGGFTEFVPLPFVHMEAPMYLKGRSRRGPTFREAILMHAVARVVFHGLIDNIQASWVKMGREGIAACLQAGVNDLGGTLMNESITRAAGSGHGQEWEPRLLEAQILAAGRQPRMRTTLYADVSAEQRAKALAAKPLGAVANQAAGKQQRSKRIDLVDVTGNAVEPGGDAGPQAQVVLMAACN